LLEYDTAKQPAVIAQALVQSVNVLAALTAICAACLSRKHSIWNCFPLLVMIVPLDAGQAMVEDT